MEKKKTLLHEQFKQINFIFEKKQFDLLYARELDILIIKEKTNKYSKIKINTIILSVHQPDKLVLIITNYFNTLPI